MEIDSDYEYSENSPVVHKAKASKPKAPKAAAPLGNSTAANVPGKKAIEDIYQKKTQLEHILLRPDTYIGSAEKQQCMLWVHNGSEMVYKNVSYTPGLYKIFDEILVNAADNKVRDPTMDTIRVDINPETNTIKVWNNGDGIPVEIHKEEKVYVPELIFGHLLTSSNYDDQEKKVTGGRNGFGAKLCNIFSTRFEVETCDGRRQRRFHQVFTNNMGTRGEPKIAACKPSDNWTCITFQPDLAKFDMTELEEDTVALMRKRVYDVAGVLGKGAKVYLNGIRLPVKSFQEYCELYLGPKEDGVARVYERINDRWEVCFSATDGTFQQVSFVNSICTNWGGTHVNYVVDQVSKYLVEKLAKKHKKANVKPFMVKNHLWVFVNAQIENPAFSSQTKDMLTSRATTFGSKCELSPQLLEKVGKAGVMDNILSFAESKNQRELKKGDGAKRSRLTGISKLSDANAAGTAGSQRCTLILTEGDSAKSLAMSGLSVVGHDHYGVFPLRGKLLNVRDATATQVSENAEIQNLKQILGLQYKKQYSDTKSLRYGHLMIMTDQDHDGSHIKGLIMNFLHAHYPELLQIPGFLAEFITPIVKARKGRQEIAFYTMPEYENWKESLGASAASWDIKYYKGLGTSSPAEAKAYFANMDLHKKQFVWEGEEDGAAIEMAFSKKKVEERKAWLSAFQPGTFLDQSVNEISYSDFVHKELILFSRADLERSIPSMVDGLKPGQRKILFCCFKRNLVKDVKVAQLSGYVSEHSAYHHGEASLQSTIVGLAQDFVGSNNINLLFPSGQFGTRLMGGKDAASPRYIYTRLAPLTRVLFPKSDDKVLTYLNEEGQAIEPEWYMPILPMVLVNGAEGIGTGWSTYIPNYNPRQIAANLLHLLRGEPLEEMQPWYRGFNGAVEEVPTRNASGKSYAISGIATPTGPDSLEIRELPVRTWTQTYKEYLETLMKPPAAAGARGAGAAGAAAERAAEGPLVADYMEHHTDVSVHFELQLVPGKLDGLTAANALDTKLKLTTKISTGNMMLFDAEGKIKRYDSPEEVLLEFFDLRLQYYELRRVTLLAEAQWELRRASNKIRFILAVIQGRLVVSNRKKAEVEGDLEAMGFDRMAKSNPSSVANMAAAAMAEGAPEGEGAEAAAAKKESFDYLLSMQIWSLTYERVQSLQEDADAAAAEVARLEVADIRAMWMQDLDDFLVEYEKWEADANAVADLLVKQRKAAGGGKGAKGGSKAKAAAAAAAGGKGSKAKKANPWSDGEDSDLDMGDEFDEEDQEFKAPKPVSKPAPKPAASKLPKPTTKAAPAAAAAATAAPTAAAPGLQPVYAAKTAAPPKPGSKAAAAIKAAAPAAAAAKPPPAAAAPQSSEGTEMSLAERLKAMALQSASDGIARQRPGRAAAAQAAKKVQQVVELSGSEDEAGADFDASSRSGAEEDGSDWGAAAGSDSEPEVLSPAPAVVAGRAAAGAVGGRGRGRGKAAAAAAAPGSAGKARASPGFKVVFGRTVPVAAPAAAAPAAAAKPAVKRKPRGRKVVSDSEDEPSSGVPPSPAYEAPTPSPAVARQKVRKMAISPLPAPKGISSRAGPAAAAAKPAKAAAGGTKKAPKASNRVICLDSDEEEEDAAPAAAGSSGAAAAAAPAGGRAAGGRARRAPVKSYAEFADEDNADDEDMSAGGDDSSDYCASD